jgi:signal transduction histidine kinase
LLERATVISAYAIFAGFLLARATTIDFGPTCPYCPVNHFYIGGYPRIFDALNAAAAVLVVGLVIAVAASLVIRWQGASRALRRVLRPPYASALLIVSVVVLARPGFDDRGPSGRRDLIVGLAILTFPIALAVGLLRGHLARAAASDLLVELSGESTLQTAAARALGDPTATLWSWDQASRTYRDDDGRAFAGPAPPGRQLAVIEHDGRRLGALECDAALGEEPERLSAVVAAIGLALDRQRLAQEVLDQLAEVDSSRARIVTAADDERRRIERNLHDGAQQRLVGVLMLLRRAHTRADAHGENDVTALLDQAAAEVDRSLREIRKLARGLQPPLLEERGLPAALEALAESSAVPTAVRVRLDARPPRAVETAAFFVVSECVANIAKHSRATSATVAIDQEPETVIVHVSDDGTGGAAITEGGGLCGLRDRVEALGGCLDVRSVPARGTTVTARLPTVR